MAPLDGLWATTGKHAGSGLPDGGLVLRDGLLQLGSTRATGRGRPSSSSQNHSSTWLIDAALEAKLMPGIETFAPEAYQRFVAATSFDAVDGQTQWERLVRPAGRAARPGPDAAHPRPDDGPHRRECGRRTGTGCSRRTAARRSPAGPKPSRCDLGNGGNDGDGARGEDGPPLAAALFDPKQGDEPDTGPALLVAGNVADRDDRGTDRAAGA